MLSGVCLCVEIGKCHNVKIGISLLGCGDYSKDLLGKNVYSLLMCTDDVSMCVVSVISFSSVPANVSHLRYNA